MADARQNGIDAAQRDIAAGILRFKWTGGGGRGGADFCQMIQDCLGMTVDDFGVCFVTQDKIAFADGYNETVREFLIAEHGRDVIAETLADARAKFRERYDRYVTSLEPDARAEQKKSHDRLLPPVPPSELITMLLEADGLRIERIVSQGQASPAGFWYDQDENEWVMVLSGSAAIEFEGEAAAVELQAGSYLNIPAHRKHRVVRTSATEKTVWLAVFYRG